MEKFREVVRQCYNKQCIVFKICAMWDLPPTTSNYLRAVYKLYFWYFLIFWMLSFETVMVMQIIKNYAQKDEVIKVFFMLAPAISVLGKYLTIKIKKNYYEDVFEQMLNVEFLPENYYEGKIFLKNMQLSQRVRNFYAGLSLSSLLTMFLTQYLNASEELPVPTYTPFELDSNWKFNLVYIYQCLCIAILCIINISFDSLSTLLFIYLKSQLDILGYRMENIGSKPNISQDYILQQLTNSIRYYNRILALSHDIEYLVSIPISVQIACSVFVLIANFYSMSVLSGSEKRAELVRIALYQACMLAQIFMLCYFSNEVTMKSEEISFNIYSSQWYNWNKVNRKMVLLMMLRFGNPIRIKSINRCYSFNLAAFTSIVNSSYSYYALLENING